MSGRRHRARYSEQNASLIRALRGEGVFVVEDEMTEGNRDIEDVPPCPQGGYASTEEYDEGLDDSACDTTHIASIDDMLERAKYIPLRLSYEERKSLRLVNAAVNLSDYTNSVDIEFASKSKRRHVQLQHICGFLSGVISAWNYDDGQRVLADRNFSDYETFLQVRLSAEIYSVVFIIFVLRHVFSLFYDW